MQSLKLLEYSQAHSKLILKRNKNVTKGLFAEKSADERDLYLVKGGKEYVQLRESYGFLGDGTDLWMYQEEVDHARSRSLLLGESGENEEDAI